MPLREAIAAYLGPSRGVQCKPDQIVIVSGTQQALDLSARVLLDPGDSVLVEEYCYSAARAALIGAGARLVPIKVDDSGLDISAPAASFIECPRGLCYAVASVPTRGHDEFASAGWRCSIGPTARVPGSWKTTMTVNTVTWRDPWRRCKDWIRVAG
jgi:hypothetical protein